MKYNPLGQTDVTISEIAMGCWTIAGDSNWGRQDEEDSIATIHTALDNGINFFDTAEAYGDGRSEAVLGEALSGMRQKVIIATKVFHTRQTGADIIKACEDSLRRLGTDYIDLYQLHWPNRNMPMAEAVESLEKLQQQGKVRAIGVCNFGVEDMEALLSLGRCETNQLPYSLLWRAIEDEIQPACLEKELGILAYSALAQGLLTGKFASVEEVPEGRTRTRHFSKDRPYARHSEEGHEKETFATIDRIRPICREIDEPMSRVALAWVRQQPGISSILVGARRPEQIVENVQALDLTLPADVIEELNAVTQDLKEKLGPNPDMWQSDSRFR